jgi:hypothetical protein
MAVLLTALGALGAPSFAQQAAPPSLHERFEERLARRAADRRRQVEAGLAEARSVGKPVLVLVVPEPTFFETDPDLAARSRILTALLLTTDVDTRCELALLQPIAAKLSELTTLAGTAPRTGLPCALLLDPPPVPRPADFTTTATPLELDGRGPDFVVPDEDVTKGVRERQLAFLTTKEAELAKALPQAIATHGIDRGALARAVESRLSADDHRAVEGWLAGGRAPEPALIVRAAPWILHTAEARPTAGRTALRTAVATAFSQWIAAAPPHGAKWPEPAYGAGCSLHPTLPALPDRLLQFHAVL